MDEDSFLTKELAQFLETLKFKNDLDHAKAILENVYSIQCKKADPEPQINCDIK